MSSKAATVPPWPPGYQAPEIVFSDGVFENPNPAADVYSLGVILAERLLGTFPFRRESYTELLMAQRNGQHASLPATPLGDLLSLTMHQDPNRQHDHGGPGSAPKIIQRHRMRRSSS